MTESRTTGSWTLSGFAEKLEAWRAQTHPPDYAYQQVRGWWPSLQHQPRAVGVVVPGQPAVRFAWVPHCHLPDLGEGIRGVQCHYRVTGGRVICQFFVTAPLDRDIE
ncbi:hypothetical protein [Actinoplanes derwentensis]|uniref:Uncharacterized protein n=1 Tax=Actinoplanes derwentensis TaxID=113562 RepID=A0A1H1W504_9ACTN|nr:hypothetical protein [Actinoplanes derwentensis]GID84037.1 hypothetical protein Ade03nite_29610 [Actinoplanes derwentensis]SDS91586.1 hypothetical protein SAMN04489716_1972 [Actinoplanes derwentensis]